MNAWAELVRAALIGSERSTRVPASNLIPEGTGETLEGQLLAHAAALGVFNRAGHLPSAPAAPLPAPCPPEERPPVSPAAHALLDRVLAAHANLLPEWLTLAASTNRLAPHVALPALLDAGRQKRALRPLILPVLGRRGAWLATQNRDWSWALGASESLNCDDTWDTAGHDTRVALLRETREYNPARARELLASTWASEKASHRAEFLAVLAVHLTLDDEAFLEAALDDRSKDVRAVAADLLARLPGSQLVARATERTARLLQLDFYSAQPTLHVTLPVECDKSMQRDGIEVKPSTAEGIGERAWWLQQLVAQVPPGHWEHAWQLPPTEILALIADHEWAAPTVRGIAQATIRHANPVWARQLIGNSEHALTADLVPLLAPAEREQLALARLHAPAPAPPQAALTVLQACTHPWSDDLTRAVLSRTRALINAPASTARTDWSTRWAWQQLLGHAALHARPDLAEEVSASWPEDAPNWPSYADAALNFTAILAFRREMHQELTP